MAGIPWMHKLYMSTRCHVICDSCMQVISSTTKCLLKAGQLKYRIKADLYLIRLGKMTGTKLRQGIYLEKQSLHCITIHCMTYFRLATIPLFTVQSHIIMFACIYNAGFLETYVIILELKVHLHPTQNCSDILVSSWQCFQLFSSYIYTCLAFPNSNYSELFNYSVCLVCPDQTL